MGGSGRASELNTMNRTRAFLIVAAVIAIVAVLGLKEYWRGHADVSDLEEAHAVEAQALLDAFLSDETAATARFVGEKEQAISVSGTIRSIEAGTGTAGDNVVLATSDDFSGIVCEFAKGTVPSAWKPGDAVAVKGVCQGYTGEGLLPGDVVLQRCVPVE
jgi:hypothetical protein